MEIYDLIIVVFLFLFAILGFKRGVFQSLISFVGFILVIVLAYSFKGYIGDFFILNLPFFKFNSGICLNIILYQTLAFLIIFSILMLVYKIIVVVTGIFEKILKFTIVLSIPSKILGLIFGFLEGYIIIYFLLFILVQPFFDFNIYAKSTYAKNILEKTPILSGITNRSLEVFYEIKDLTEEEESNKLDLQMADVILKEKVTSVDVMQKLVDSKKVEIEGIDNVINKYR